MSEAVPEPAAAVDRFQTPTGAPCPRTLRPDGTVEGSGDCCACGYCVLLELGAWPDDAFGI